MTNSSSEKSEESRLRALGSFDILDESALPTLDCLVQVASALCGTPIALVSLVDRDRLLFKARSGLDVGQVPRTGSLCNYAIQTPQSMLEVRDASCDPRFAASPLVTGAPGIRFYAGVPLVTSEDEALGTLCVIDRQARVLTESQRAGLLSLAQVAVQMLESRGRELALRAALGRRKGSASTVHAVASAEK